MYLFTKSQNLYQWDWRMKENIENIKGKHRKSLFW